MHNDTGRKRRFLGVSRSFWLTWAPAIVVALGGMFAAGWLLEPPCPTTVEIATGSRQGAYYAFAQQYQAILARHGIDLKIRSTAGSVENAQLLNDEQSGVSLAFVQSGAVPRTKAGDLQSLASLYLEPVWIFYRDSDPNWNELSRLRGRRVAIGPEGSGTRALALTMLAENEISADDGQGTQLLPWGADAAAAALIAGEIDAAMFVISPQSPLVAALLLRQDVHLLSLRRAAAYCRNFRYLSNVQLSEGLLDLTHNVPQRDNSLIAPTACLVARADLHPALVPLMLEAATEVHSGGNFLEEPGEFPSPHHVDLPLSESARRYFNRGPSALYRYFPFRLAAWLDRTKVMLLPLLTLLFPLAKYAAPVYRWRIREKIYRWYAVLREIDQKLKNADDDVDFSADIARLRRLEAELAEVSVPLSYMEEFYNLRLHISYVLTRLDEYQRNGQSRRGAA